MAAVVELTRADKLRLLALEEEKARRERRLRLPTYFPDAGPLRRELYPQHLQFFQLDARFSTRCFMAANRVGKTEGGGGYETVLHLTGRYPTWWRGHRFDRPIDARAAGDTKETVRDIIQLKLVGPVNDHGRADAGRRPDPPRSSGKTAKAHWTTWRFAT